MIVWIIFVKIKSICVFLTFFFLSPIYERFLYFVENSLYCLKGREMKGKKKTREKKKLLILVAR